MFRRETAVAVPSRQRLLREVRSRLAAEDRSVSLTGVEEVLRQVLTDEQVEWNATRMRRAARAIADDLSGFGPIGPLVRDPEVTEVLVNAPGEVYVERRGRLERVDVGFSSDEEISHLIERVLSPLGLRVDASMPWVDARLPDGSRFHAVIPPVALRGPTLSIRRFSSEEWTMEGLVRSGSVPEGVAVRLHDSVRGRRNVLVSGGAGTGKTTLLGVLARLVPADERIITIEDTAELRLSGRHVVALECRPPNVEGRGEVGMRDLVRCAMRMRPDRIVVGEVRGAEALDMLQALTSGHAGSMATLHANAASEALLRLEMMTLTASSGLSVAAVRRQVAAAIEVVVHLSRDADGTRRVAELAEVELSERGPVVRRIPVEAGR